MSDSLGHTAQVEVLLAQLQAGDSAASQRLIEHACERLRHLAGRMLRRFPQVHRWEQTDDVFTEAVTRLHAGISHVRPESSRHFYNLAATQMRRVLIDLARKHYGPQGIGANHESGVQVGESDDAPRPAAEAVAASEPADLQEWSDFHEAVERLPGEEREVLDLLWYDGLSQEAAAEVLATSVRTIKRRWQSARFLIGKSLQGKSQ